MSFGLLSVRAELVEAPVANSFKGLVMFWVYILRCADGSHYTGHTDNLERRIGQHQAGECEGYTATRCPVNLVWLQEFVRREEALSAERQITGWNRKKKEAMMCGDWQEVARLGRRSKKGDPSTGSG